jgi:trehalose/maltose transport system permease protein
VTTTPVAGEVERDQYADEGLAIAQRRYSEGKRAERRLGLLLCAPAVIIMLAVCAYPVLYAFWLSLNRADLRTPNANKFIGFENYVTVLSSSIWWTAVWVTLVITVVSVAFELVLGMALALVMHRTIGKWTSIAIIILAEIWKTVPFMALLLMAGLALVPDDLLKAASMDGASLWQRFWRITLPLMKPAILVAVLFRTLDAFRIFDNIFVLTNGSNETGSVSIVAYDNLIRGLNLGIGSTMAILIFLMIAVIAFVFIKLFGAAAPGAGREGRR